MHLLANQQAIINLLIRRQKNIEKKQYQYEQLLTEAQQQEKEKKQLANALKNEITDYEKKGTYSVISINQQRRKQAIILSSLNICQTQIKEIIYKQEKLKQERLELDKQYVIAIKKQKKMQFYFDRKQQQRTVYLESLEQLEIQELKLYDNDNI